MASLSRLFSQRAMPIAQAPATGLETLGSALGQLLGQGIGGYQEAQQENIMAQQQAQQQQGLMNLLSQVGLSPEQSQLFLQATPQLQSKILEPLLTPKMAGVGTSPEVVKQLRSDKSYLAAQKAAPVASSVLDNLQRIEQLANLNTVSFGTGLRRLAPTALQSQDQQELESLLKDTVTKLTTAGAGTGKMSQYFARLVEAGKLSTAMGKDAFLNRLRQIRSEMSKIAQTPSAMEQIVMQQGSVPLDLDTQVSQFLGKAKASQKKNEISAEEAISPQGEVLAEQGQFASPEGEMTFQEEILSPERQQERLLAERAASESIPAQALRVGATGLERVPEIGLGLLNLLSSIGGLPEQFQPMTPQAFREDIQKRAGLPESYFELQPGVESVVGESIPRIATSAAVGVGLIPAIASNILGEGASQLVESFGAGPIAQIAADLSLAALGGKLGRSINKMITKDPQRANTLIKNITSDLYSKEKDLGSKIKIGGKYEQPLKDLEKIENKIKRTGTAALSQAERGKLEQDISAFKQVLAPDATLDTVFELKKDFNKLDKNPKKAYGRFNKELLDLSKNVLSDVGSAEYNKAWTAADKLYSAQNWGTSLPALLKSDKIEKIVSKSPYLLTALGFKSGPSGAISGAISGVALKAFGPDFIRSSAQTLKKAATSPVRAQKILSTLKEIDPKLMADVIKESAANNAAGFLKAILKFNKEAERKAAGKK